MTSWRYALATDSNVKLGSSPLKPRQSSSSAKKSTCDKFCILLELCRGERCAFTKLGTATNSIPKFRFCIKDNVSEDGVVCKVGPNKCGDGIKSSVGEITP